MPEPYLDAWARRLQCQWPAGVPEDVCWQAIDDGEWFLNQWESLAVEFRWTPADSFDVPRDRRPAGLVWFLKGETVRALGPGPMATKGERMFDRVAE